VVRYGTVMGRRGSVSPFFMRQRETGVLPLTHPEMTRFNITLQAGVELVLFALENAWGGEIFVPKIPSYRITELARAIGPDCKHEVVGIRPGEKLHEEMITEADSFSTIEFDKYFVITPSTEQWDVDEYAETNGGTRCKLGFRYNSGTNTEWLSVDQIQQLIREHCDPAFESKS